MSKKELSMVEAFKGKYSHLCKGKSDEEILTCIRFIEATQHEIQTQVKLHSEFINAVKLELKAEMTVI